MTTLAWVATISIAATMQLDAPNPSDISRPSNQSVETRMLPHQFRTHVHETLVREARAQTFGERADAVRSLVDLYDALGQNTQLSQRERIRLRAKLRSRLKRVDADLRRQIDQPRESSANSSNPGTPAGGGAVNRHDPLVELIETTIAPDSWRARGGRGVVMRPGHAPGGALGGAGHREGAKALIELIESTIAPDTWEVNGGRGVIRYWPGS